MLSQISCGKDALKEFTFKKGIKTPHNKYTAHSPLAECPVPDTVCIPLSQHIGKPALPLVAAGDRVLAGSRIGGADGFVSADVFSSVSGVVKGIERHKTVTGFCPHVIIENDGEHRQKNFAPLKDITRESVLSRIKECGLVGMGGAGFPAHVKYAPKSHVDTFIINAAECEPFITCDYRLLIEHTNEVLSGAALLAKTLGLDEFVIGIENNKPDAIAALNSGISDLSLKCRVVVLKSKYPQGAEKQLIYAVTKRKVPLGKLPADVGVVVGNVHTAFSLHRAVYDGTPLYERALTVCGGGITEPRNLWVKTGTGMGFIAEYCGGVKDCCAKTVSGGPMMGIALYDTDYYITKTSGAILFLNTEQACADMPYACINCGKCEKACPMNLMPMYIDAYTLRGDYHTAVRYGALNCIECGCCAYSCPAKRPIVQSVKLCKIKAKELGL